MNTFDRIAEWKKSGSTDSFILWDMKRRLTEIDDKEQSEEAEIEE